MFICEKNYQCVDCPELYPEETCDHWIEVEPLSYVNNKLSDIVDDALSELNAINSNGDLDYDVYVELHNIISNIYNRFIYER